VIPRTVFSEEHEAFRATVRRFLAKEVVPFHAQWEQDGKVSREVWLAAGDAGLLCCNIPEAYGGLGGDFLFSAVVVEEMARVGATGPGWYLHSDIVAPYILNYGTEEMKKAWLPRMARGEAIGAIAMTEPVAGSDLQGIATTARRDGDAYVINGQKVFITNGQLCDLVLVVCKTNPAAAKGYEGMSIVLVEGDRPGFEKGRNLDKVGRRAQDTSELFFADVRVPLSNLLGLAEGQGFVQLMQQLPQERLLQAIHGASTIEAALGWTAEYTRGRRAFGRAIADFQNTRFKLAEIKTQAVVARTFVDRCLELHVKRDLDAVDAAMAKMWVTDLLCSVLDACVQLHGGYGYMWEYPIARAWADSRVARIAGGSAEIMREIIGRSV